MPRSHPGTSLQSLTGRVVFCAAGTPYYWEDVILAAHLGGAWADLQTEVCDGLACLSHLRATRAVLDDAMVETAACAFRETRQLFTAAETEAWLAQRGVTVDNWMKYIRRSLLRRQWTSQLPTLTARYPPAEARVNRSLKIVGICSGHLGQFAHHLAGRAAVHERLQNEVGTPLASAEPREAALSAVVDPAPGELGLTPERLQERRELLARLECSFERFRQQVLTTEAIRRQITARHTDWIRLECLSVSFANEAAAREAALCVRQDGEDLHDVAARARTVVHARHFKLEDLEPLLYGAFLSAGKGELLGPLAVGQEFQLFLVCDKTLPFDKDPITQRLAEQALLQDLLDREIGLRIQWRHRLD
jgi:hypothetical protein